MNRSIYAVAVSLLGMFGVALVSVVSSKLRISSAVALVALFGVVEHVPGEVVTPRDPTSGEQFGEG